MVTEGKLSAILGASLLSDISIRVLKSLSVIELHLFNWILEEINDMTNDLYYTGWHAILWNIKIHRNLTCAIWSFVQFSSIFRHPTRDVLSLILYRITFNNSNNNWYSYIICNETYVDRWVRVFWKLRMLEQLTTKATISFGCCFA